MGVSSVCVSVVNDFHWRAVSHASFMYSAVGLQQVSSTCRLCSDVSFLCNTMTETNLIWSESKRRTGLVWCSVVWCAMLCFYVVWFRTVECCRFHSFRNSEACIIFNIYIRIQWSFDIAIIIHDYRGRNPAIALYLFSFCSLLSRILSASLDSREDTYESNKQNSVRKISKKSPSR